MIFFSLYNFIFSVDGTTRANNSGLFESEILSTRLPYSNVDDLMNNCFYWGSTSYGDLYVFDLYIPFHMN